MAEERKKTETSAKENEKGAAEKPKRKPRSAATRKSGQGAPKQAAKPRASKAETGKAKKAADKAPAKSDADAPKSTPKSTPARRRPPARESAPPRPVVRAQAKYVRSSARKARLVIEHIRGRGVDDARAVLRHTPRSVARDLEKLLDSAVANAENNHELVGDDLVVKEAYADEGPTIKRFRPRALGRATRIRKRTSHLTLTLTTKD
jgi:ribosomal protein L22